MATTVSPHTDGHLSLQQSRIGIATLRFQNRQYQFPSIIVRNNGKQQCIMLDVCLLCPFCSGDIKARVIPLESRILLAQGQNRHSYPPAGPDVVMQCEDLATSFARQFPHLLSPGSREHLAHCNVADRLSQSADESMMATHGPQLQKTARLKIDETNETVCVTTRDNDEYRDKEVPVPGQTSYALDSTDSDANAEGDSTQTSDTDSVDSVRYTGDKYSTVKRAFPHDVIRSVISESASEETHKETVKRSPKSSASPKVSPKGSPKGSRRRSSRGSKSPPGESDENDDDDHPPGDRTTAVVVKSTIHQTVAELLDLPSESDSEDTGADKGKTDPSKKLLSMDNIRSVSQLSDYGSMESMSNSHERLRRSRSEGMGSMESSLYSSKKLTSSKSEIKAAIGNVKELPESVTKEFVKLRSKIKKVNPDASWSYDDLRELYKGAGLGSAPFRHSQGDRIATVYPVFDFRREASPRGRQEGDRTQRSPRTSQADVASQPGLVPADNIPANQPQQLDVNANVNSAVNMNVPNVRLRQEAAPTLSDDRDADERGIEDAEKEMERVVGEMTSLEAELEQMYRMTAKSRQQRPGQDGGATNLGDSSTTLASLQERQRIEQEEIERMQELEDERRRPFVAEAKQDKRQSSKPEKQAKRVPKEEAQFEEEERRVQLWLREQQKRQKILQKQNLTQQDRRRLQMLNEQRRQQFLQERLRLQLEARNQQMEPSEQNIPSQMSQEDYKRRQRVKEKLQRQAEQLHQMQMQALYQQQRPNEHQAERQWQAIQEHHRRVLQEQAEAAGQTTAPPQERKVKPPVPPKPKFGVPRVDNLAKKDETPPQVRRMRNVMSFLESSSNEALQESQPKPSTTRAQGQTLESSTSSSAAESYSYQHLYEEEALASLENEDLNYYDEENDTVIDKTGDVNKVDEAECLIQDPEHVYAQHIQAKDISQMLDILERVVDGSKKRKKDEDAHSGSSSSDEEEVEISEKDPEDTVDEILENIDTDSYSPNATLSRVFTQPRRKKQTMQTVKELEPVAATKETDEQCLEMTVDAVLEEMDAVEEAESSQLFDSVITTETTQQDIVKEKKELKVQKDDVIEEVPMVPESEVAQFTAADLVPRGLEEKQSSSTECLPDDNTSLEMERSICYSENTSETTSYDEDSVDLQAAEAKMSKESSAEIKQMIVKTTAMTHEIMESNQQYPPEYSEVRMRMLTPIMEEKSNRSSAISTRSSGVSDGRSPRSSEAMTDSKSNRSSAMSSDLLTDLSSDRRSSTLTEISSSQSSEVLSNRSSAALSNRSSQGLESPPEASDGAETWGQESFESQIPAHDVQGATEVVCETPTKSASEYSGDILLDETMLVEPISRSESTSPRDNILLTSSESESGASLQRRIWSRNQYQLSPYAYEYGEAVGHEMGDPVHIRLYPSVEDMMPRHLPPEQVDHQLTVITDSLALDVFQEGKPALSPRSPMIFSPTSDDKEFVDVFPVGVALDEQVVPAEMGVSTEQMELMEETTQNTQQMAMQEDAMITSMEELSREMVPSVTGEVSQKPDVIAQIEVDNEKQGQVECYTVEQQSLDIVEITTEVNKRPWSPEVSTEVSPKAKVQRQAAIEVHDPDIVVPEAESKTKEVHEVVESAIEPEATMEKPSEVVDVKSPVEKKTDMKQQEQVTITDVTDVITTSEKMDSSSESLDISSEEDEITNVMELLHKVKREYEAEIPKYEGQLPQAEVREKETEAQEEKQPKSDSDSGSEVVIDDSGSGDVFKIKLDRQSSLHFQRLSRENSLRDDMTKAEAKTVDDISDEFAFNMHVRSLERLASLSRESLNVSSESSTTEGSGGKKEQEETGEVVHREKEAINRLESLITVESEPQTPENVRYSPDLDSTILEHEFAAPLEMTSSGLFQQNSMDSIKEIDEIIEEKEEDDAVKAVELERSISQTSQLDIIVEEEDLASQDSKTSSPSKKSTDTVIEVDTCEMLIEDNVAETVMEDNAQATLTEDNVSETLVEDNLSETFIDDNVSAETSSSFAISEGSSNTGQPDLLHNVIVCAGAMMTRGSDSDIPTDTDSSSDGFGSMKAATLKIRLTDKKPPIHPSAEAKHTANYRPYGDIILGQEDGDEGDEPEMAIFNFRQALAMFEGMTQGQEDNGRTMIEQEDEGQLEQLESEEVPQEMSSSYVATAIRSHEKYMQEATFGTRREGETVKPPTEADFQPEHHENEKPSTVATEMNLQEVAVDQQKVEEKLAQNQVAVTDTLAVEVKNSYAFEEDSVNGTIICSEPRVGGTDDATEEARSTDDATADSSRAAAKDAFATALQAVENMIEDLSAMQSSREFVEVEQEHLVTELTEEDHVAECADVPELKTLTPEGQMEVNCEEVITELVNEDHSAIDTVITEHKTMEQEEQIETSNTEHLQPLIDEAVTSSVQEADVVASSDITQEIVPSCAQETQSAEVENVRDISPVALAACNGAEVLINLENVKQKEITPTHAEQMETDSEETVEVIRGSSPAEPELLMHEKDLSTVQDVFQEESMVSESGELVNADSCAELSSRESEASDVTVITTSFLLDSRDDLTQEQTRVEEISSPSPDQLGRLSSSEDVSAEEVTTPAVQDTLDASASSQETSFVLEEQESLSITDIRNLTPVPAEPVGEATVELHSPARNLVDFERSLSSQEASFVHERNDSASDSDVRDLTPVPDDALDVSEVAPKTSNEALQSSAPDIFIADYDEFSPFKSDDFSGSDDLDKRSTIDSQKSAISLIQAVSKSSDTEEVVSVSPDVTQISLLEQQAEYQRYKDDAVVLSESAELTSSSTRSSMNSNQERFESYADVSKQEEELEVASSSLNQQQGLMLVQPGVFGSEKLEESDSFDDLHRSPSFQRNKPRRSPSTSSSEKAAMTYSQERSFETSFEAGQPVTEWHASRTATYESKGNVLYHEESQISSDTEGSLRRRKKVLIKRPSTEGDQYETQTFVKEDVSPTPAFQPPANIIAIRTDSVSEGEEGDDEKEFSASSSGSGSREGSFIRYSSAEDVNDILDKVRAVVFEASRYQQDSQTETNGHSTYDNPDESLTESGVETPVGATEQEIKDYFINREDEGLKQKELETEEFLRNLLQRHHHDHVSKESTKHKTDVTDISACLEDVCRAMSESDSDEQVVEEDIQTQEVTLVFAWPKSTKPLFQYADRPYREICLRRITKIRDFDIDVVEGPALDTVSASGSQSDSNQTGTGAEQQTESSKPTASGNGQCRTQGESKNNNKDSESRVSEPSDEINITKQDASCVAPDPGVFTASQDVLATNVPVGSVDESNKPKITSNEQLCVQTTNLSDISSVCVEGSGNCGETEEKESSGPLVLEIKIEANRGGESSGKQVVEEVGKVADQVVKSKALRVECQSTEVAQMGVENGGTSDEHDRSNTDKSEKVLKLIEVKSSMREDSVNETCHTQQETKLVGPDEAAQIQDNIAKESAKTALESVGHKPKHETEISQDEQEETKIEGVEDQHYIENASCGISAVTEQHVKGLGEEVHEVSEVGILERRDSQELLEHYANQLCQVVLANALKQVKAIYQQVEERIAECRGVHNQRQAMPTLDLGVPNSPVPIKRNVSKRVMHGDLGITNSPVLPRREEFLIVQREVTFEESWNSPIKFQRKMSIAEVTNENVSQETVRTVSAPAGNTIVSEGVNVDELTSTASGLMSQSMQDSGIECQESRDTLNESFSEDQIAEGVVKEVKTSTIGVRRENKSDETISSNVKLEESAEKPEIETDEPSLTNTSEEAKSADVEIAGFTEAKEIAGEVNTSVTDCSGEVNSSDLEVTKRQETAEIQNYISDMSPSVKEAEVCIVSLHSPNAHDKLMIGESRHEEQLKTESVTPFVETKARGGTICIGEMLGSSSTPHSKEKVIDSSAITPGSKSKSVVVHSVQEMPECSKLETKARGSTPCIAEMLGSPPPSECRDPNAPNSYVDKSNKDVVVQETSKCNRLDAKARVSTVHIVDMLNSKEDSVTTSRVSTSGVEVRSGGEVALKSPECNSPAAVPAKDDHTDSDESLNSLLDKLEFRYPSESVEPVVPMSSENEHSVEQNNASQKGVEIIREYKETGMRNGSGSDEEIKRDEIVIFPTETKVTKVEIPVAQSKESQESTRKLGRHLMTSAEDLLYPDLIRSVKERKSEGISDLLSSMLGCSLPELCSSSHVPERQVSRPLSEQLSHENKDAENKSKSETEVSNREHPPVMTSTPTRSDSGFDEYNMMRSKLELMSPLGELHVDVGESSSLFKNEGNTKISSDDTSTITPQGSDITISSAQDSCETTSTTTTTQDSDNWLVDHYEVQKLKLPPPVPDIPSSSDESDVTVTEVKGTTRITKTKRQVVVSVEEAKFPDLVFKQAPILPDAEQSDAYSEMCDAVLSGSEGAPSTVSTSMDSDRGSSSSCASVKQSPPVVKADASKQGTAPRMGLPPIPPARIFKGNGISPDQFTPRSSQVTTNPRDLKQVSFQSCRSPQGKVMDMSADEEMGSSVCDDIWTPNTKRHAEALKGKELSELIQEQKSMFAKLQEMRTSFDELLHEVETVKYDICKDDEVLQGRHGSLYENIAKLRPLSGIDHQLADQKQNKDTGKPGEPQIEEVSVNETAEANQAPQMYQPRYRAIDDDVLDLSSLYLIDRRETKPIERSISSPVLSPQFPRREEKFLDLTVSSPCLSPEAVRKPKISEHVRESRSAQVLPVKEKIRVAMEKLRQPTFKSKTPPEDMKKTERVRWADLDEFSGSGNDQQKKYSSSPQIGKVNVRDVGSERGGERKYSIDDVADPLAKQESFRRGEALGIRRAFGSAVIRSRSLDNRAPRTGYQMDSFDDDEEEGDAQYARWRSNRYSELRHQRAKPLDLEARNKQFQSHLLAKGGKDDRQKSATGFFSFKRFTQGKR